MFSFPLFASSPSVSSPSSKIPSEQSVSPPSAPFSSSIFSFFLDFNKNHRAAVTALSEARKEARDTGVERREGMRKRVKEMVDRTGTGNDVERTTPE
jgi:hypothetical protein